MKKIKISLNLLCVLIIGVVPLSTSVGVSNFTTGVIDGYEAASSDPQELDDALIHVALMPNISTVAAPRDSVMTVKGDKVPIIISKGSLCIPDNVISDGTIIGQVLSLVSELIIFIILLVAFVKFIFRINRGNIFDRRNIRLLFRIGIYLLLIVAAEIAGLLIDYHAVKSAIAPIAGYDITIWPSFPWSTLVLGLVAIVMSIIWEIGLELKNDNELTI